MAENGKNGNGNGNGKSVTLGGMKLPIAVIGVIVVQAFGIIWYVANLDSTVKNMQQNVTQMQEAATTVDVAVMQTDIVNLKDKIMMIFSFRLTMSVCITATSTVVAASCI